MHHDYTQTFIISTYQFKENVLLQLVQLVLLPNQLSLKVELE